MNPEDEKHASQLIEALKRQNEAMKPMTLPQRNPEHIAGDPTINEQAVLSSVNTAGPAPPAQGAFAECPQCGVMHPPIPGGGKCPNAKVEIKEANVTDEDINKFLSSLKNISVSQIQSKGIKDGNKLFKYLTIELMKALEGYSE